MIENLANELNLKRVDEPIKPAIIQGLPRQSVLKPAQSKYRLQLQRFALGDRVVMVDIAGTGGVPLGLKGAVVGINTGTVDVVWDSGFLGGNNLGNRFVRLVEPLDRLLTYPLTSVLSDAPTSEDPLSLTRLV